MPFDCLPMISDDISPSDRLFRTRRKNAADIWRDIPPEHFSMLHWKNGERFCALGWLGILQYDGWSYENYYAEGKDKRFMFVPKPPETNDDKEDIEKIYVGAACYFGLTVTQAANCFFASQDSADIIAYRLLSMPYSDEPSSSCSFDDLIR